MKSTKDTRSAYSHQKPIFLPGWWMLPFTILGLILWWKLIVGIWDLYNDAVSPAEKMQNVHVGIEVPVLPFSVTPKLSEYTILKINSEATTHMVPSTLWPLFLQLPVL